MTGAGSTVPALSVSSATSDVDIGALASELEQKRVNAGLTKDGADPSEPPRTRFDNTLKPIAELPPRSDADLEAERQRMARAERLDKFGQFINAIGVRYAGCSLDTFELSTDAGIRTMQERVLSRAGMLIENLRQHTRDGGNVIIYGPPGTGKDHLLVSLARVAIVDLGAAVSWTNGQEMFGQFRDHIGSDLPEWRMVRGYCRDQVLAISDPVPPKGETSVYSANTLYRVLDQRYRHRQSTWVTINVATEKEASEHLGGPVFDRLLDNAATLFCNWPSYRRARKPEWMK